MKKLIFILFLLLAGCIGGFKTLTSKNVDCGENIQAPRISADLVKAYAPAELRDFLQGAPSYQCVDKRYVGLIPPGCKGEGWGCAVLDPYFWGFADKEQSAQVFVFDVPGKGVGLWFEVPKQPDRKVIVCEHLSVRKGMESAQGLLKELCYANAGEFTKDESFCAKITNTDIKTECEARTYLSVNKCDVISNKAVKYECISAVARVVNDISLCGRIDDPSEQGTCRLSITGLKPASKGAVVSQN